MIQKNSPNRYYQFWAADSFGQEIGFFFTSVDVGDKIFSYAKEANENIDQPLQLLQVTDGETDEGFQEL